MIVQRVLLIGNHPISRDIEGQFAQQGAEVLRADFPQAGAPLADVGGGRIGRVDALCLFSVPDTESDNEADNCCLDLLKRLATEEAATTGVELKREDGQRIVCHLLLQSQTTLWALQNFDLPEAVNQMFDVYAFTMEDQWAKAAFASVGGRGRCCPPLDREAITEHSPKRVHLVLIGWNEATESLAIHAALVSHFPNYVGNHQLRTRITIVDERMDERADAFIGRYHHLFDNSYYRRLDLTKETPRTAFHAPRYNGQRDEFVDIEWEFVKAGSYHPLLREKLALWAADRTQVLTVALCHADDACNANEAFCLVQYQTGDSMSRNIWRQYIDSPRSFAKMRRLEMTLELAKEQGLEVDVAGFEEANRKHQELSRTTSAGSFKAGLQDNSEVVTRMHTATHLLHAALHKVLGPTANQKGSNITAERLRFDFTWPEKMTDAQIAEVEKLVNEWIAQGIEVTKKMTTVEEAKAEGAMALFGAKYGDQVSLYTIGDVSKEICCGPHVQNTKELGSFKIQKEQSSSAGVRRIKAVIGNM